MFFHVGFRGKRDSMGNVLPDDSWPLSTIIFQQSASLQIVFHFPQGWSCCFRNHLARCLKRGGFLHLWSTHILHMGPYSPQWHRTGDICVCGCQLRSTWPIFLSGHVVPISLCSMDDTGNVVCREFTVCRHLGGKAQSYLGQLLLNRQVRTPYFSTALA